MADASRKARIHPSTAYARKARDPRFARSVEQAREAGGAKPRPRRAAEANPHWQPDFLEALAETSNVSAAAAHARVDKRLAYAQRRGDKDFARLWGAALLEGYEHLEMELLGYLRDPDPARKMDVANALRLLAAHKETAARERATRNREDEAEVLASLKQKISSMRQRREAAQRLLSENVTLIGPDGDGTQ